MLPKKIVVNENERGLLFENGRYRKLLGPGPYILWGGREVETVPLASSLKSKKCPVETLLRDPEVKRQTLLVEIQDRQLGLHYVNGKFLNVLLPGRVVFWTAADRHEVRTVDLTNPEVSPEVPRYIFPQIPGTLYLKAEVASYQRGRLYYDKTFQRLLEPGTYYFWQTDVKVSVEPVDMRLLQLNVTGQELLTQDKVSLRISYVVNYRVTDCVKIQTEIDSAEEQLHLAVQLALRDYVGRQRLDDILEHKDEISQYVQARLKEREAALYIEVADGGVKDIILPGEIRDIMNTVLVAEKRAQANVITRREEVASTRSLLNTAKLMDENQTLYRLKELEYIEKICENVGDIKLSGTGDLLTQLTNLLHKE